MGALSFRALESLESEPQACLHLAARALLEGSGAALADVGAVLRRGAVDAALRAGQVGVQDIARRIVACTIENVEGIPRGLDFESLSEEFVVPREANVGENEWIKPDLVRRSERDVWHHSIQLLQLGEREKILADQERACGRGLTCIH